MRMDQTRACRALRAVFTLVFVASLAACASAGKKTAPTPSYDGLMTEAESLVSANRFEEALDTFEKAAKADTTRKEPWVRAAQLNFDTGNYGRAIVAAQEVLQRDAGDTVAESVLTVSGFRVAAQSLQRLQASGALGSEAAQREARQLATAMRTTMGPEIVADPDAEPVRRPARTSRPRPTASPQPAAQPAEPPKPATKPANPFDKLGGN